MAVFYTNGIGASSGHALTTESPYIGLTGGTVHYLGPGGSDAADGARRETPLATLDQAHTNAVAGDTIVCLPGHAETIAVSQVFNKVGITLVSEGTGSNRARFTCGGTITMFDVQATQVQFLNLYFPSSTAEGDARIEVNSTGSRIEDCQFDCGALDTAYAVTYNAGNIWVSGTTFTSVAAGAIGGIYLDDDPAIVGLDMQDVTFDGGSFGWTSYAFLSESPELRGVRALRINQLNDSDVRLLTSPTGYWVVGVTTGSARFEQT